MGSKFVLRGSIAGAIFGALILSLALPAQAKIVERERYSFSETSMVEECGLDLISEFSTSGVFKIRADKKDSTAFFGHDNFSFREVLTNPETGKWLVIRGKGNFKEVKATHVEGDVFLFRQHLAGQPFVIESSEGNVVLRERGLVVWEVLFDTLGDDVPGGEILEIELVAVRGHPDGFDEDICPIVLELLE
jgi:hypothetical protein